MQRTASSRREEVQMPSGILVLYAALVLALLIVNVVGYGLIALTF